MPFYGSVDLVVAAIQPIRIQYQINHGIVPNLSINTPFFFG